MEIILNCGDKINIPDGCKAEIKDGVITIEKERTETPKFKDGDFVTSIGGRVMGIVYECRDNNGDPVIYMHWDNDSKLGQFKKWRAEVFRLATEKERQTITAQMAEQNLRWNAEEKELEWIRWRAEDGEEYCYVGNQGIIMVDKEDGHCADKNRHEFGNYFRTREQAEGAAKLVKATLRRFYEDYESNK